MSNKHLTLSIDELSVVLKWSLAYAHTIPDLAEAIGNDRLLQPELSALREKLSQVDPQFILGAVNAGILLGFTTAESAAPLQDAWEAFRGIPDALPASEETVRERRAALRSFLTESGLIEPSND